MRAIATYIFIVIVKHVSATQIENDIVRRSALLRTESPSTFQAPFVGEEKITEEPFVEACRGFGEPPHYFHDQSIKPINFDTYALHDHEFDTVPIRGDYSGIQTFLRKLAVGGAGRLVLIGNSFTSGYLCGLDAPAGTSISKAPSSGDNLDCAWQARLVGWLQKMFPQASIKVENMAIGVSSTASASNVCAHLSRLSQITKLEADLIFIDLLQSDVTDFLSDGTATAECYENYIRQLHAIAPGSVITALLAGDPHVARSSYYYLERAVVEYYNVPYVDFTVLVRSHTDRFWPGGGGNPPSRTHQLVADLISHAWGTSFMSMCNKTNEAAPAYPIQPMLKGSTDTDTCSKPRNHYTASMKNEELPEVLTGDWRLYEDIPGSPGWIASVPGARLRFKVSFDSNAQLKVTYLKSNKGLGQAYMLLKGSDYELSRNLTGTWGKHESEPFTELTQGLPDTTMDLHFVVVAGKFKVLEVISC